jgi:hypothetical protein
MVLDSGRLSALVGVYRRFQKLRFRVFVAISFGIRGEEGGEDANQVRDTSRDRSSLRDDSLGWLDPSSIILNDTLHL